MEQMIIRRPKTLFEVAAESRAYREFGMNLKDFLHEFKEAKERGEPLAPMLRDEPPRLASLFPEGDVCDAFIAGTADYLSRVNNIEPPNWSLAADRMLEHPWFSEPYLSMRLRLLRDTPSAFKDKNIFVLESALSVA